MQRNPGFSSGALARDAQYCEWEERIMGAEPLLYATEENRSALAAVVEYAYDQDFAPRKLEPEELFAPRRCRRPGLVALAEGLA